MNTRREHAEIYDLRSVARAHTNTTKLLYEAQYRMSGRYVVSCHRLPNARSICRDFTKSKIFQYKIQRIIAQKNGFHYRIPLMPMLNRIT